MQCPVDAVEVDSKLGQGLTQNEAQIINDHASAYSLPFAFAVKHAHHCLRHPHRKNMHTQRRDHKHEHAAHTYIMHARTSTMHPDCPAVAIHHPPAREQQLHTTA